MGASPGQFGTVRAQHHLRQMFVFLNMQALCRPEVLVGSAAQRFDENGNLTDEDTKARVEKLVAALAEWTRRLQKVQAVG